MRDKDKKSLCARGVVVATALALAGCSDGPSDGEVLAAMMKAYDPLWRGLDLVDRTGRGSAQALLKAPRWAEESSSLRVPLKVLDAACGEKLEEGEKVAWRCRPKVTAGPRPEVVQGLADAKNLGPVRERKVWNRWAPVLSALATGDKAFTTRETILMVRVRDEWVAAADMTKGHYVFPGLVPAKTD